MTQYERIRREIISIEREIAQLRNSATEAHEQDSLQKIYLRNERIRDSFHDVRCGQASQET